MPQQENPEIDTDVLRYVFGDLLYDMEASEKSMLKRKLISVGKNIGARKMRMAINAEFGRDPDKKSKLREIYIDKGTYVQKMIGKALMISTPAVAEVAKSYFSNAQDYYTVGQIAAISDMNDQTGNISQAISRFRKHRDGMIRTSEESGLAIEIVEIGGHAGTAYRFVKFGPTEEHLEPDMVFIIQPKQFPSLDGNVKDLYEQFKVHKERGAKTVFHRLPRSEAISIYKIKDGTARWTEIDTASGRAKVRHIDAPANRR